MNSNTFARKSYLTNTWVNTEQENFLSHANNNNSVIVDVDLLRATANEAEEFKSYLENLELVKDNVMVINLTKCSFVDSTFLSAIIRFSKKSAKINNSVKLVISDVRQFSIFKITKIDKIFNIYPTIEQALLNS